MVLSWLIWDRFANTTPDSQNTTSDNVAYEIQQFYVGNEYDRNEEF